MSIRYSRGSSSASVQLEARTLLAVVAVVVSSAACATSGSLSATTAANAAIPSSSIVVPEQSRSPAHAPASNVPERVVAATLIRVYPETVLMGTFALTRGEVWLTSSTSMVSIDPSTNEVRSYAETPGSSLYIIDDVIWQTTFRLSKVTRYDATTVTPQVVVDIESPEGIDGDENGVWIAAHHSGSVIRLDPESGGIVAAIAVGPEGQSGPMFPQLAPSGVWAAVPNINSVVRIDPTTNRVAATINVPGSVVPCGGTAVGEDAIWVSTCFDGTDAIHIDPLTNAVSGTTGLGGPNGQPILIDGVPWFPVGHLIVRIDPQTDEVDRVIRFADIDFQGAASIVGFDSVWIASPDGRVARLPVDELR